MKIKLKEHFITTINAATFLVGTGITLDDVSIGGTHSYNLHFSSSLNDTQLDSLSTEIENYVTPEIVIDNIPITTDIGICDKTSYTSTKQFSYSGTDFSPVYNYVSFYAFRVEGTGNYHFRVWDTTNQLVLAEINNYNNTTMQRYLTPLTNLPSGNAILDLQCYVDNVDTIAQFSNVEFVNKL